jgi:predicted amidohydrolase
VLRAGLAQITGAPFAAAENRALSLRAAGELFARGADLVVVPELIVPGYVADAERLAAIAEPLDGPTTAAWRSLAAQAGGMIAGGFCERDGDRLFNTAVIVDGEGIVVHYRKLHLFREEKLAFAPGDRGLPVARTRLGVLGLCVCYDLRFVETARALALRGAELVCVPTAWVAGFDTARWDAEGYCPQARGALLQANLDQVFLACASQVGTPGGDAEFLGSSVLADPYGRAVAGPLSCTEDELALAHVDLDEVARAHEREPLVTPLADRRTDVYGLALEGTVL